MKVSDLAAELEVPASAVLEQCQRFGIDASWAGAELSGADVVVLRGELAGADAPIDLTPVDAADGADAAATSEPVDGDEPAAAEVPVPPDPPAPPPVTGGSALPPTAVGSMPELIDEVTPQPAPEEVPSSRGPGAQFAGANQEVAPDDTRTIPPRQWDGKRRLDRYARNGLIALVIGGLAFAASNAFEAAGVVAALWLLAGVASIVAVVDAYRATRHITTHPDRLRGLVMAWMVFVLGIGALVGLTAAVVTVVRDEPAADSPVGELASVQAARWGYQRFERIRDQGWHRPARDEGSCWGEGEREYRRKDLQRVEIPHLTDDLRCNEAHTAEVAVVFAVNRDADAPYPGESGFVELAAAKCGRTVQQVAGEGADLRAEWPTEAGWDAGDHDVACLLVTPARKSPLLSD